MYEGGLKIEMHSQGGMGRAKVAHGDSKVADELHTAWIAEHKITSGGLIRMVREACMSSCSLSPLVGDHPNIYPLTSLDKVKECGEVIRIPIKVSNPEGWPFWSKQ